MLSGKSVFLTGPPGAGKTYVLNEFIRRAKNSGKRLAITASTGIAATHIGGTTVHSWSGLGIKDDLSEHDWQTLGSSKKLAARYNGTDVLIIDEVSMLHGKRLDMLNRAAKILRSSETPFGGLQVILVGDLFQLPPVTRGESLGDRLDFVHTSDAWQELNPLICYLHEQHRQQNDALLDLLQAMRRGNVTDVHHQMLQSRIGQQAQTDVPVTRLYAHNVDVDTVNQRHLAALSSKSQVFEAKTKGNAIKVEQLANRVLAPATLELKVGAEVMFVANDHARKIANGSLGIVVAFRDGKPLVKLTNGRLVGVEPYSWMLEEDGHVRAEITQLPLRLAWAITIHKSQGMSLDAAEIDLGKAFTTGMGYVALSRVRSMDGVFLLDINSAALQMHPEIYEFDQQLQQLSDALSMTMPEQPELPEDKPLPTVATATDGSLLDRLKQWRASRAQTDRVAPYMIGHNIMLEQIAQTKPRTSQQLLGVKGFGERKLETYGPEILDIVREFLGAEDGETPAKIDPEATVRELFQQGATLDEVCRELQCTPTEAWALLQASLKN